MPDPVLFLATDVGAFTGGLPRKALGLVKGIPRTQFIMTSIVVLM